MFLNFESERLKPGGKMISKSLGKRGGVFSQLRVDHEQVQALRNKVVRRGGLFCLVLLALGFWFKFMQTSGEVAASQVVVDRSYLESLESRSARPEDQIQAKSAGTVARVISPLFTKEVQHWANEIVIWADEYGLDPNLVATVMQIESCGDSQAISSSGASGLFQVMSFNFGAGEDRLDPENNARTGLAYLKRSLELAEGDLYLALAGYNGGHSVIAIDPALWYDETKRYVYWGTGIFSDAQAGRESSLRLSEWLSAGGSSLCRRAAETLSLP